MYKRQLSIIYGFWAGNSVLKSNPGSEKMQEISSAIQIGAQAYLNRQYTTIAIVGAVICILLYLFFGDFWVVGGFLIGAILSGAAGYIGMIISVRANVRTEKDDSESIGKSLKVEFKDYYFSNVIARSSKTMVECNNSKLNLKKTGTEG